MKKTHAAPRRRRLLPAIMFAASASAASLALAGPIEEANKKLVLEFFQVVLNGRDADAAPKYIGETYIQHNPRVPDGMAALQGFVRELKRVAPEARVDVIRVVAESDLVVLHSHSMRNPQDRGMVQADIFRVRDGKIVEHWDIFQPIPETAANTNGMY